VATKGVVQLFNAIFQQQRRFSDQINDKTTLEKPDFVDMSQKHFLDLLKKKNKIGVKHRPIDQGNDDDEDDAFSSKFVFTKSRVATGSGAHSKVDWLNDTYAVGSDKKTKWEQADDEEADSNRIGDSHYARVEQQLEQDIDDDSL